jgi:hypothetical protein
MGRERAQRHARAGYVVLRSHSSLARGREHDDKTAFAPYACQCPSPFPWRCVRVPAPGLPEQCANTVSRSFIRPVGSDASNATRESHTASDAFSPGASAAGIPPPPPLRPISRRRPPNQSSWRPGPIIPTGTLWMQSNIVRLTAVSCSARRGEFIC